MKTFHILVIIFALIITGLGVYIGTVLESRWGFLPIIIAIIILLITLYITDKHESQKNIGGHS